MFTREYVRTTGQKYTEDTLKLQKDLSIFITFTKYMIYL